MQGQFNFTKVPTPNQVRKMIYFGLRHIADLINSSTPETLT